MARTALRLTTYNYSFMYKCIEQTGDDALGLQACSSVCTTPCV